MSKRTKKKTPQKKGTAASNTEQDVVPNLSSSGTGELETAPAAAPDSHEESRASHPAQTDDGASEGAEPAHDDRDTRASTPVVAGAEGESAEPEPHTNADEAWAGTETATRTRLTAVDDVDVFPFDNARAASVESAELQFDSEFDVATLYEPEGAEQADNAGPADPEEEAERAHLRGAIEALVFASDSPIKPSEIAKLASTSLRQVKEALDELQRIYAPRGIHLDEVAGGWVFRTSPQYAPFVRDLTKQKPVRLTRSQVETLAIIAYRQPVTRPEVDEVRGVDSGPVVKVLLERDLVRILGKRDEPGRPLIYGTTNHFLEFFGLRSLKDLPTLREFTELSDESREVFEEELGVTPDAGSAFDETRGLEDDAPDPEPESSRAPQESMRVPAGEGAFEEGDGPEAVEPAPISGVEGIPHDVPADISSADVVAGAVPHDDDDDDDD